MVNAYVWTVCVAGLSKLLLIYTSISFLEKRVVTYALFLTNGRLWGMNGSKQYKTANLRKNHERTN